MDVKVHEDYESIDRENLEVFNKTGLKRPEEDRFRCVICGEPACIDNSISHRGHGLIHTWCANKAFSYENGLDVFKWMAELD